MDTEATLRRFLRYLLSGGILVAIDYAVFFTMLSVLGAGLALAQGSARLAGAVSGFFMNRDFVFGADYCGNSAGISPPPGKAPSETPRVREQGRTIRQGFSYGALTVLNIGLSALCADILGNGLGLKPDLVVKFATDAILAGETFVLLHYVFRKRANA